MNKCSDCGDKIQRVGDFSGRYFRIGKLNHKTAYIHEECDPALQDYLSAAARNTSRVETSRVEIHNVLMRVLDKTA